MNAPRHTSRPPKRELDPRWWLLPAAVAGGATVVTLLGLFAASDVTLIAPAAQVSPEFPIAPEPAGDPSVPDASGIDFAHDASGEAPPPTF
jgi:hypothetical protein